MILETDADILERMLGDGSIPSALEDEYQLRLRMLHAAGVSGPLGAIALVDLVRACGIRPEIVMPERPPTVDWQSLPQDGSTLVEAQFNGQWMPGKFIGFVGDGTLQVKLDNDDYVRECHGHMVRLPPMKARPLKVKKEKKKG